MSTTLSAPTLNPDIESGAVEVTRTIAASATEVWKALTDPQVAAQWFGSLLTPLCRGQSVRLDFGDGDFFILQDILLEPPHLLHYAWRFLGTGPLDTITWHVHPKDQGCEVTVRDTEPHRTREEALQLRKGWLDFTRRLKDFFARSRPTRYSWRHDFEGSIELAGELGEVWQRLFENRALAGWLPLEVAAALEAGARLVPADGLEPSALQVSEVVWNAPASVSFELSHESWRHSTRCELELSRRPHNILLNVTHNNWPAISLDKDYQKQQRKRFSEFWIQTLIGARHLIA